MIIQCLDPTKSPRSYRSLDRWSFGGSYIGTAKTRISNFKVAVDCVYLKPCSFYTPNPSVWYPYFDKGNNNNLFFIENQFISPSNHIKYKCLYLNKVLICIMHGNHKFIITEKSSNHFQKNRGKKNRKEK